MHGALRARHSLAMQFATFADCGVEAFDPFIDLKQAKRDLSGREGKGVQSVGNWWMEGGMGVTVPTPARPPCMSAQRRYPAQVTFGGVP